MSKDTKKFTYGWKQALSATIGGFFSSIGGAIRRGMVNAIREGVEAFIQLDKGVREVSTLLNNQELENAGGLEGLKTQAKELALTFGQDIPTATKAMYQAISAGVQQKDLQATMESAGKLAVGGITDLKTSIEGMTAAYNAFGKTVEDSKNITDIYFIGMKNGITTVDELAKNIGKVAPIASSMNVSLEETVAAMSALTTQNIKTATATTMLRGTIKSVLKPSSGAKEIMDELGIAYGETALKNQKLQEWLTSTKEKLEASGKGFKDIFGNIRALNGAMVLTGEAGEKYVDIMDQMSEASKNAGQLTEDAFGKMEESAEFKFKQLKQDLLNVFTEIFDALYPAIEALMPAIRKLIPTLKTIGDIITGFLNSPFFKFALDWTNMMFEGLGRLLAPAETAKRKFTELNKEIEQTKNKLNTIKDIRFGTEIAEEAEELRKKIEEVRKAAPEIAEELDAISNSSLNAAKKQKLMNLTLDEYEEKLKKENIKKAKQMMLEYREATVNLTWEMKENSKELEKLQKKYDEGTISDKEIVKMDKLKSELEKLKLEWEAGFAQVESAGLSEQIYEDFTESSKYIQKTFALTDRIDFWNIPKWKENINQTQALIDEYYDNIETRSDVAKQKIEQERQARSKLTDDYIEVINIAKKEKLSQEDTNKLLEDRLKISKQNTKQLEQDLQDRIKLLETLKKSTEKLRKFGVEVDTSEFDDKIDDVKDALIELKGESKVQVDVTISGEQIKGIETGYGRMVQYVQAAWAVADENIAKHQEMTLEDNFAEIERSYEIMLRKIEDDHELSEEEKTRLTVEAEKQRNERVAAIMTGSTGALAARQTVEDKINDAIKSGGDELEKQIVMVRALLDEELKKLEVLETQAEQRKKELEIEKQKAAIKERTAKAELGRQKTLMKTLEQAAGWGTKSFADKQLDAITGGYFDQFKTQYAQMYQLNMDIAATSSEMVGAGATKDMIDNQLNQIDTSVNLQKETADAVRSTLQDLEAMFEAGPAGGGGDALTEYEKQLKLVREAEAKMRKEIAEATTPEAKRREEILGLENIIEELEKLQGLAKTTEESYDIETRIIELKKEKTNLENNALQIAKKYYSTLQQEHAIELKQLELAHERKDGTDEELTNEEKKLEKAELKKKQNEDLIAQQQKILEAQGLSEDEYKNNEVYLDLLLNQIALEEEIAELEKSKLERLEEQKAETEKTFEKRLEELETEMEIAKIREEDGENSDRYIKAEREKLKVELEKLDTLIDQTIQIYLQQGLSEDEIENQQELIELLEKRAEVGEKLKNMGEDEAESEADEESNIDTNTKNILEDRKKKHELIRREMALQGASQKEILDLYIYQLRMLKFMATTEEERLWIDEEIKKTQEELNKIQEQEAKEREESLDKATKQVEDFANALIDAFKDGSISAEEFVNIVDDLLQDIIIAIPGILNAISEDILSEIPGLTGAILNAVYSGLKLIGAGLDLIFTDRTAQEQAEQAKQDSEELNTLLETRVKIHKALVALGKIEKDDIQAQIDLQQDLLKLIKARLGLEGSSAEEIKESYLDALDKYKEIEEAIFAIQNDIADDNFWQGMGNWFAGLVGMSKEDQLAALQAELELLGYEIQNYEELLSILEDIEKLEQQRLENLKASIKENYDIIKLRAELNDNEEAALQAQIDYLKEMLDRADELELTEKERLELQLELKELYEEQNAELAKQGLLLNENIRAVIRQVNQAQLIGNMQQEQDAIWQAAVNLLQQGLSPEQINEMLGTDLDLSGFMTSDVGGSTTDRALSRQIDSANRTANYMKAQNELTKDQTLTLSNLLQQVIFHIKSNGVGGSSVTTSASDTKRFLQETDRIIRN